MSPYCHTIYYSFIVDLPWKLAVGSLNYLSATQIDLGITIGILLRVEHRALHHTLFHINFKMIV